MKFAHEILFLWQSFDFHDVLGQAFTCTFFTQTRTEIPEMHPHNMSRHFTSGFTLFHAVCSSSFFCCCLCTREHIVSRVYVETRLTWPRVSDTVILNKTARSRGTFLRFLFSKTTMVNGGSGENKSFTRSIHPTAGTKTKQNFKKKKKKERIITCHKFFKSGFQIFPSPSFVGAVGPQPDWHCNYAADPRPCRKLHLRAD